MLVIPDGAPSLDRWDNRIISPRHLLGNLNWRSNRVVWESCRHKTEENTEIGRGWIETIVVIKLLCEVVNPVPTPKYYRKPSIHMNILILKLVNLSKVRLQLDSRVVESIFDSGAQRSPLLVIKLERNIFILINIKRSVLTYYQCVIWIQSYWNQTPFSDQILRCSKNRAYCSHWHLSF